MIYDTLKNKIDKSIWLLLFLNMSNAIYWLIDLIHIEHLTAQLAIVPVSCIVTEYFVERQFLMKGGSQWCRVMDKLGYPENY